VLDPGIYDAFPLGAPSEDCRDFSEKTRFALSPSNGGRVSRV